MESFRIEHINFTYPNQTKTALTDICFSIQQGEFVLLCGKSGCGKTTLLRLLKPVLSPSGQRTGKIYFEGKLLSDCTHMEQASKIGFVMQNPDNQLVTDKVWHELAFGLESLGYDTAQIRARVSEMASFFGMEGWFYKNTFELSGGQKQLLNLASVMATAPSVLILDEPTSQLDPIAASAFLKTLEKINRELGTTVILSEHRLEEAFALADRVIIMDESKIIANNVPKNIGSSLKGHDMYDALPVPVQIFESLPSSLPCPVTVRDGRHFLEAYVKTHTAYPHLIPKDKSRNETAPEIEIKDVFFRYEKNEPDVVKNANLCVNKGELFFLVGGNGTGKTTLLSLVSGLISPHRGEVLLNGKHISRIKNLYNGYLGVLPQNPECVFVKKTVYLDLKDVLTGKHLSEAEQKNKIQAISSLCKIDTLLTAHPFDLSGGEKQRAALAKILLSEPQILLLDEPTKGMDAHFKAEFGEILDSLKQKGVTVLAVTHDIEFCAEHADRCALMFDGSITSEGAPREFFKGKTFYTTAANRMARTTLPDAVLTDDILLAFGKIVVKKEKSNAQKEIRWTENETKENNMQKRNPLKKITGIIFAVLFLLTSFLIARKIQIPIFQNSKIFDAVFLRVLAVIEIFFCFRCFFPQKKQEIIWVRPSGTHKLKTIWITLLVLLLVPLTLYAGIRFLDNRKYLFISLIVMLEISLPFCMLFEARKPKAREIVIISVLCAIAVSGRTVFFCFTALQAHYRHCHYLGHLLWERNRIPGRRSICIGVQLFLRARALDALANVCTGHNRLQRRHTL